MTRERAQDLNINRRVLGNFRKTPAEKHAMKAPKSWRAKRTGMSPEHLERIRQLGCAVCPENRNIEAHHLKSDAAKRERGVSLKATDRWAVPLCGRVHHPEIERLGSRREVEWFLSHGVDCHALAQALWNASEHGVAHMRRVREAHSQAAILHLTGHLRDMLARRPA